MNTTSIIANDYRTNKPICVEIDDGHISGISDTTKTPTQNMYIGPGLVDMQINGYKGLDLNHPELNVDDVVLLTQRLWAEGITLFYPTIITNSDNNIEFLLKVLHKSWQSDQLTHKCIGGIHLEGPFISPENGPRGAHPAEYVKPPSWDLFSRWQEAAGGLVRIITLSPEWPNSFEFIKRCVDSGVIVSIGHTAASPEQIRKAVDAGATISTHLGNASHPLLPRHSNYIWEQLASDNLWITMIADGFHLPSALLKVFLKVKPDSSILVSDATSYTGMPPGTYSGHIGGEVQLNTDGMLSVKGNPNLLAGSAQPLKWGISHLVKKNILPLENAWNLGSVNPLRFLSGNTINGLHVGQPADLVLFSHKEGLIEIYQTIKSGTTVFSKTI